MMLFFGVMQASFSVRCTMRLFLAAQISLSVGFHLPIEDTYASRFVCNTHLFKPRNIT
jgi:hypothetical protein